MTLVGLSNGVELKQSLMGVLRSHSTVSYGNATITVHGFSFLLDLKQFERYV